MVLPWNWSVPLVAGLVVGWMMSLLLILVIGQREIMKKLEELTPAAGASRNK